MTEPSSAPSTVGSTAGSTAPGTIALETESAPTGTRDAWVEAAAGVLRKARRLAADDPATEQQVLDLLARRTPDGLTVPPLGNRSDLAGTDTVPTRRGTDTTDGWDIRVAVIDPDPAQARAALLADLEGGASSGWVRVGSAGVTPEQLGTVLEPVLLDIAPVVLDIRDTDPLAAVDAFGAIYTERSLTPAPGTSFGLDPFGLALRSGETADLGGLGEIASRATALGVGAFVVDGTAAHDAGATDAQEIGWTLAAGVAYLRALTDAGIDPTAAAALIDFRYAVTVEQFASIAKLRAARQLWARVLQVSGIDGGAQRQHAVTSRPMTTRYDPWVNMLRTTIAAFAAGTGGAQAVTVQPFDSALGIPDAFGRRIARNVAHLLVGESHVAAVADPAGGAPAIELLTSELAAAGWAEFGRIEQVGGAAAALADGSVAGRIAESRDRRAERVATRKQPLTGVSEFPNLDETLPTRRIADGPATGGDDVAAWAAPFEQLRDAPASSPVFLATLGPVAAHSTRAGFAANALAAGGIATVRAGATDGVNDVVAAYRAADGDLPVVCLTGTDAAYTDTGPATVEALRAAGARAVLLAGKPGPDLADLIDDRIALGDDIVALGRRIRRHLEGVSA